MLNLSTASHGDGYALVGKRSLTEKYSEAHLVRSFAVLHYTRKGGGEL